MLLKGSEACFFKSRGIVNKQQIDLSIFSFSLASLKFGSFQNIYTSMFAPILTGEHWVTYEKGFD